MEKSFSVLEKTPVLDAGLMIFEVITRNPRAPSVEFQRRANREDGTVPDREFELPGDEQLLVLLMTEGQGDVLAIAHPKIFGGAKTARAIVEAMGRVGALVKLPAEDAIPMDDVEERDRFVVRVTSTPWGKGTRKQLRNPGRPHKRKQPTAEQKATYCRMWHNPEQFKPRQIRALAGEELGRDVAHWELKAWCGDKRGDDGKD